MQYRADIEGLRAVAIVPIVLFHAGLESIAGGFVGVDVFYVISGFLITSIIVPDLERDRFSLLDFYRKRAVRILPALYVMVAVVLVVGSQRLFPDDLRSLAASATAAVAFVSNIHFWLSAGYFGPAAESLPLLHTWSLGVEQQFYLFYPLLLMAIRRFAPGRVVAILVATAITSFALSLAWAYRAPTDGFYLLPSRVWELVLGGLVALGAFPKLATARGRDAAALAGLGLVLLGTAIIRAQDHFPAPWGLLPAGGTALIAAYGAEAVTARLFTWAPVRRIGAISYSLYLWHWPIITFWRFEIGDKLTLADTAIVVAASYVAAELSYRLVEQPALKRWRKGRSGPILAGNLGVGVAVAAMAFVASSFAEHWRSYPPEVRKVASYADYRAWPVHQAQFIEGTCFVSLGMVYDRENCLAMSPTKKNMLVFGDSHAAQYWRAIADRYSDWNVAQATGAACRPMHGVSTESHCNDFVPYVLDKYLPTHRFDVIVLAGRWLAGEDQILAGAIKAMQATGARVVVIGPVVEYDGEAPQIVADALMRGDPERAGRRRIMERRERDRAMAPVVKATGADWISAWDIECPADRCRLLDDEGGPMHFDYGHVTQSAAKTIVSHLPAF
jgi:peptidoglycan/LPS O-acetylase OafA/YrhL